VLEKRGSGGIMTTDKISARAGGLDGFTRATFGIRQFSNGASGSITVDFDRSHDKIANSKGDGEARFVGAFSMERLVFFSEDAEHLLRKLSSGGSSEPKKSMCIGCLIGSRSWSGGET
jgi:hypothetical protein